jgi:hypothetical protein
VGHSREQPAREVEETFVSVRLAKPSPTGKRVCLQGEDQTNLTLERVPLGPPDWIEHGLTKTGRLEEMLTFGKQLLASAPWRQWGGPQPRTTSPGGRGDICQCAACKTESNGKKSLSPRGRPN